LSKTKKGARPRDPHARREARRYDRPIASREHVLEVLAGLDGPVPEGDLADALGLDDERDRDALGRRLRAMERDGQLVRNRRAGFGLLAKMDLARGRVSVHRDGYGFLAPDGGGEDLYLPPRQLRAVMHGDRVVARVTGLDRRGRREGAVVEVLERATRQVVGRLRRERDIAFVQPEDRRLSQDVLIPADGLGGAGDGQIVVAELTAYPDKRSAPIGRVTEVLGEHMAPGMEIDVAIRAHGLPLAWPEDVAAEAAALGARVPATARRGREDLRSLPLVTIDGADARDFDDAVWCQPTRGGWRLLVAIADVSAYVRPGSALDREARERGNSVYFPERVVPMLPEALSNGLCSLVPEEDRLCLACEMRVNAQGRVTRSRFLEGVMRSHARLTYDEVAAVLDGDRRARRRRADLVPHLEALHALYGALRAQREDRGAIDLDTVESRIVFGAERKIERVEPVVRNDAHRLIEECMIAANVAAARTLARSRLPVLYRVHAGPGAEKLDALRSFLGGFGLRLGGGKSPEPAHYAQLIRRVSGRPESRLFQTVLLRSLAQAEYSPDNIGHFGLALECYTHFTSPIRRYPDLVVHRAIRHLLRDRRSRQYPYGAEDMAAIGDHCSATERRADDATRDAVSWLKCEFMLDKVGELYDGIISGVASFGIFVELDEIFVEGLVHVSELGADYFHFDPVHHRLEGERTRRVHRLADRVRVRVVRVDLDERKVDFELISPAPAAARGGGRRGRLRRGAVRRR